MRIFLPPSRVRSRSVVSAPAPAAKIAAIEPAAPAPMTTTRRGECGVGGGGDIGPKLTENAETGHFAGDDTTRQTTREAFYASPRLADRGR